ncbi:DUF5667 domain-containing protein [Streptosporangium sp. NPDC004379]|uniref:DUF5667 domain-containing protein n=1 Tax=Streptosporangium sp. NPDC004379 TaxID=3366189 RepID=UPI0036B31BBA
MGEWLPGISRGSRARARSHVTRLGTRMDGVPRPEFRAGLRERLTNAVREDPAGTDPAQEDLAGADEPAAPVVPAPRARHRRRGRRGVRVRRPRPGRLYRLVSAGLVTAMLAAALVTYRSMPGETLYPLKRAAESTLFHLSADEAERADRSFGYAETRAHEVEELLGSSRREKRLIRQTLKDMEDTTRSAVSSLTRVRRRDSRESRQLKRFVQKQRNQIEGMLPRLDVEEQRRANGYLHYIIQLAPPG